ncbi:MAG: vWA domain-containing protein [Phycisphaeraceae bacterium]
MVNSSNAKQVDLDQQQPSAHDEVRDALAGVLPWGVSILLHAALVLLAVFIVWSTLRPAVDTYEVTMTTVSTTPTPLIDTKAVELPTDSAQRVLTPTRQPASHLTTPTQSIPIIGIGLPAGNNQPRMDFAPSGEAGVFVEPKPPGGEQAKRIAYVIDGSGSLLDSLPFVVRELKRSINDLGPEQSFVVIFFQSGKAMRIGSTRLLDATPENCLAVCNALDEVRPQGVTNPVEAIRMALAHRPQVMYLLSDNITGRGQYEIDQATLLAEIKKARAVPTRINTIQFLYNDSQETLKKISQTFEGQYKFLDSSEIENLP